ncbi:MAG: glycosyltransferase [Deltaproteobacteria bacterium]|nr:glycosyltransferase [Deltaproteobacteria bacterium]
MIRPEPAKSPKPSAPVRVFHVITTLEVGGAERMLEKLLCSMDRERFPCRVASLIPGGEVAEAIRGLGVEAFDLGMRRGRPSVAGLARLVSLLRDYRPRVVQTWMYHADLLGLAAARLARTGKVVWNIRSSGVEAEDGPLLTRAVIRACAGLSRFPDAVAANSRSGKRRHQAIGFSPKRWVILPNGFDLSRFFPDPEAGRAFRKTLGLAGDALLVGVVGRWHPVKDMPVFFAAAEEAARALPNARFVLCGRGMDWDNPELSELAARHKVADRLHPLGLVADVPRVMTGLDLLVSSSRGEGFSNVLGEAMACGVPCAATDTGDAADILGPCGQVVPPGDPKALARAMVKVLSLSSDKRKKLGMEARERVSTRFSLEAAAEAYQNFYLCLAREGAP